MKTSRRDSQSISAIIARRGSPELKAKHAEVKREKERAKARETIVGIKMVSERDADCFRYEVVAQTAEDVFEGMENERTLWTLEVPFGKDSRHCAGGYAFVEAECEQAIIAEEAWFCRADGPTKLRQRFETRK